MTNQPLILLCPLLFVTPAVAGEVLDRLLATTPKVEAEKSFARGDLRSIVIPICGKERGEVIPGWPLKDSPEIRQALEEGRRPVVCADIEPDPNAMRFKRLAKYAELYNHRMLELSSARGKRNGL